MKGWEVHEGQGEWSRIKGNVLGKTCRHWV